MEDDYAAVAKGKLKLKTDSEISKKKKKKKTKQMEKEKIQQIIHESQQNESVPEPESYNTVRKLTKAEISFKQMQEKMQKKRILDKASMTHKQRVEKFNEHLDSLTEHFDIPKVSWTK